MKVIKLILKVFLGFVLLLIAFGILMVTMFFSVNGKDQANKEQQFMVNPGEKSALVLYQESRMGLTNKAVKLVSSTLQAEGYSVTLNHPRSDSAYNVQDYDIIVLASPVYAGQVSVPLLNYAGEQDFTGKKVLVLLTGSDLAQTAELEAVEEKVSGASTLNSIKVDEADERLSDAMKKLIER